MRAQDRRAALGVLAALLYVALAVILPGWHLAAHRPDHDHGSGSVHRLLRLDLARALARTAEHAHGHTHGEHGPHESAEPRPGKALGIGPPPPPRPALVAGAGDLPDPGSAHGSGSLLHFAEAFLAAAGLPVALRATLLAERLPPLAPCSQHRTRPPGGPLGARAPPGSAPSC